MKNLRQIFLLVTVVSLLPLNTVFAESSNVNVVTNSNTTSTSNSTVTSNTHIRIETNGVVKECDSRKGEDCTHMESDDGSSTVNVNSKTSGNHIEIEDDNTDVTPAPHSSNSAKTLKSEQKKIIKEQEPSLIEEIKDFFKSIFETLKLKL